MQSVATSCESGTTPPRKPLHPAIVAVAVLLLAGFSQLLELFMSGAGHGWSSPLDTSPWTYLFALLFGALVFVRHTARTSERATRAIRSVYYLLALAAGAALVTKDVGIVQRTNLEGWSYAEKICSQMFPLMLVWLAVVAGMHILVMMALFRRFARAERRRRLE